MRSDAGTATVRYLEALVSASCEGDGNEFPLWEVGGAVAGRSREKSLTLGGHRRQLEPVEPVSWRQESHSKKDQSTAFSNGVSSLLALGRTIELDEKLQSAKTNPTQPSPVRGSRPSMSCSSIRVPSRRGRSA
jgi:hypothetical protein